MISVGKNKKNFLSYDVTEIKETTIIFAITQVAIV